MRETPASQWDDLVDRLAAYDIRYLMGGSGREQPSTEDTILDEECLARLIVDLARAPQARLRDALSVLFLRHPETARIAETAGRALPPEDPARCLILVSIVVAAALQSEWSFSLEVYLPKQERIAADRLATELDLPSPESDFGRPCLRAAADLLRAGAPFPFNYESTWEDGVHRLLSQLNIEARRRGA